MKLCGFSTKSCAAIISQGSPQIFFYERHISCMVAASRNTHRNAYNIACVELRNEHAHGRPCPHLIFGWFAILRTATRRDVAWHGASLATIFEHSSAHESRRAAAEAARPIKSIRTCYKGCGRADLINIVNTARRSACVTPRRIAVRRIVNQA